MPSRMQAKWVFALNELELRHTSNCVSPDQTDDSLKWINPKCFSLIAVRHLRTANQFFLFFENKNKMRLSRLSCYSLKFIVIIVIRFVTLVRSFLVRFAPLWRRFALHYPQFLTMHTRTPMLTQPASVFIELMWVERQICTVRLAVKPGWEMKECE